MSLPAARAVEIILRGGVVPIVRLPNLEAAGRLAQTLLDAGVTAYELTLTSPGALGVLKRLRGEVLAFEDGRAVIGAGSVMTESQADEAISAGAQFIVSPVADARLIARCVKRDTAVLPGALTPQEIHAAWSQGASLVKVFPAHVFGPVYMQDLLAPMPQLKLIPTGGITLENAADYIRGGAAAIGVGSSLVNPARIAAGQWNLLAVTAQSFRDAVQAGRISR